MLTRLLSFFLIISSPATFGQSRLDSLLPVAHDLPDDSSRVQAYLDIAWDLLRKDARSSLAYADTAEQLSTILGLRRHQAQALRSKSFASSGLGNYAVAEDYLQAALDVFTELEDKSMIVDTRVEFGWLKQKQSQLEEAMNYYMEALPDAESLSSRNNVARINSYMAGIYKLLKQYDKALTHYQTALSIVEELDIKPGISACLTNIASLYSDLQQYDSAIFFHEEALQLKKELGDNLGTGRVLNNLGVVYNNLELFDEAERRFSEALEYAEKVDNPQLTSIILFGRMVSLFGKGEYDRAIETGLAVLPRADTLSDLELTTQVHAKLADSYRENGDYRQAYLHSDLSRMFADSLYNEKILEITGDLEARYQKEQQQRKIEALTSEKNMQLLQLQKSETARNWIVAFSLIALLTAGLIYHQYLTKQKLTKELMTLDAAKSRFFANISHEFRTPLTLIKGPVDYLAQNPGETLSREHIRMIRGNTNRLLNLVNQLLDLSRIDQGKLVLRPAEGDVYKCLRAATSSFYSHAAQRHINFKVFIPPGVLWVLFDRDKFEKVVYNLLSNAFKFTDDGELIAFRVSHAGQILTLEVSDTGCGIAREKLPFIFDRFYQADTSSTREKEGTGIGLSLSKDLVELMGGSVTVVSEPGKGSFFTVQIPVSEIKPGSATAVSALQAPVIPNEINQPERTETDKRNLPLVLLVEDNRDMRSFIKENLIGDYRVEEAWNGMEGFKKALANLPDLIVSDLMMPEMDGLELCNKLKSHMATSHIPVIILTARAGLDNKIQGLGQGADDYLVKPFEPRELLARAANLIDLRRNLGATYRKTDSSSSRVYVTPMDETFINEVLILLEAEHGNSGFGVSQMQQALGMSKSQLHRKLKALTDEAPGEFLRNFRLRRAARFLSVRADTVSQIAYRVGFTDVSYFTKCFKSLYGVVPSRYPEEVIT